MKKHGMLCRILCLFVFIVLLAACNRKVTYTENPEWSNLSDRQQAMLTYLETTGMQVIKQGMRFTFVIPTDCFFVKTTRELKAHRVKDLMVLAQFIRSYTNYFVSSRIKITGYTDEVWLAPARDKLSLRYAKTIASNLEENGVHSRMIDVRGSGANHPIASNEYPMGTAFNKRVEITIH